MKFTKNYTDYVLNPCYVNWKTYLYDDAVLLHKAHLAMLYEQKVIPGQVAVEIKKGIEAIEKKELPDSIPEGVEDLYFLYEKELGKKIGTHNAGYLHTARSRNDMDGEIFRMFIRSRLLDVFDLLKEFFSVAEKKIKSSMNTQLLLFTHGQPANASTLAHYLSAFVLDMFETCKMLEAAYNSVNVSMMGSCAITTTSFNISRERVSDLLGFDKPIENSYQAIVSSNWLTFSASALKLLMTNMTRLVADMAHKASCEVGILAFPDDLVQISSIMPQKRNPVILEHIRIQCSLAAGIFSGIVDMFHSAPYHDINENADAPVIELHKGIEFAMSAINLLIDTFNGISVNEERNNEISVSSGSTTTQLADEFVLQYGLDFRLAHTIVSAYVRSNYSNDVLRERYEKEAGKKLELSDSQICDILSPQHFVEVRKISGGPAMEGMKPVIAAMEKNICQYAEKLNAFHSHIAEAYKELDKAFSCIA